MSIECQLNELLPELNEGDAALSVTGVCQDSRQVKSGYLFIARSGLQHRGADYIEPAASSGAVAALADALEITAEEAAGFSIPVIRVESLVSRIGEIASRFYGRPSADLLMIGITGTNGKTSCANFVATALNTSGIRAAVIGTIGNGFPGELKGATHTTPDAVSLQRVLAELKQQGAEAIVMEVSSHAIDQGRINGVEFDIAAFSNLSRDHLDYHGSMDAYGAAKSRLFTDFGITQHVINIDDSYGREIAQRLDAGHQTLSCAEQNASADLVVLEQELSLSGMALKMKIGEQVVTVRNKLLGQFNVANVLLTAGILYQAGFSAQQVIEGLESLTPVCGRMECIAEDGAPLIVVDYAHTPDALEKALQAVRLHQPDKLWCVFGCGGDRDTGKRAEMAAAASELADVAVVTSDNPRTEDPQTIVDMVAKGLLEGRQAHVEVDRRAAIEFAVNEAGARDIVLVAGKGHEDYQEINGIRHPFSDQQVVREAMTKRGRA